MCSLIHARLIFVSQSRRAAPVISYLSSLGISDGGIIRKSQSRRTGPVTSDDTFDIAKRTMSKKSQSRLLPDPVTSYEGLHLRGNVGHDGRVAIPPC